MPLPWDPLEESTRLAALHALGVLDTPADPALDALVRAAAAICEVPISLISLVDSERQWFKANHGLSDVSETPRDWSFCSHAIATPAPLEVRDARADARFLANPLVTGPPGIRFYFGVPLALSDGERIGTLCVIDQKPRCLGPRQRQALAELGHAVARLLQRHPTQAADELRQRALEELAASSTQAIVLTDAEGRTVWTNQAFTEMSGYPLAELRGRKPGAVLQLAETDPATVAQIRAAMAARRICRTELLNARRDGRRYWTALEIHPVLRPNDVLAGYISFQQDVTARKQVEQELAESRLLLQQAASAAGFGAGYLDLASGLVRWDPLCARLLGVGPDFQPTLERCLALFLPDSAERFRAALAHAIAAREPLSVELCRTLPDGRERWIQVSGRIEFRDEQPVRMIGGLLDVTAMKRTEQALADSQAFLEHAGQIAGVGAYRVDLDSGCAEWSPQTCRMHEVPENFRPTLDQAIAFYPPECRPTVERLVGEAIAQEGRFEFELPLVTARGRQIWVQATGEVFREADGRRVLVGGVLDISDRKRAQAALQQNEARLRALFELSPVGITLQDAETRKVLDANPALLQMVGFTLEEHLQHARSVLTPSEYEEGSLRQLQKVLETGSYGPYEKEVYRRDGSRLPVRLQGRSFRDEDGRTLVWTMVEDLTHSRRVDRMKREFVSVVSHELRTPLTALRGAIGLMKRLPASTTGPGAELLQIAEQNCLRLGFLVDDLLDMERLSAGKLRLELTAVPVSELLSEATASHRTYLSGRRDGIRVIEPVPLVNVLADRQRLIQVLSNLLSNALKFSPPEGVVELGAEQLGPRLRFWVQDQGPGIPEDFREQIFDRFAQADASDTRRMGGSGLGLAIVRELTQLMDGGVGFVSAPGRGTRFWIELPLADAAPAAPPTEPAP